MEKISWAWWHSFNPSTHEAEEQRKVDPCESKARLVYRVSFNTILS